MIEADLVHTCEQTRKVQHIWYRVAVQCSCGLMARQDKTYLDNDVILLEGLVVEGALQNILHSSSIPQLQDTAASEQLGQNNLTHEAAQAWSPTNRCNHQGNVNKAL